MIRATVFSGDRLWRFLKARHESVHGPLTGRFIGGRRRCLVLITEPRKRGKR